MLEAMNARIVEYASLIKGAEPTKNYLPEAGAADQPKMMTNAPSSGNSLPVPYKRWDVDCFKYEGDGIFIRSTITVEHDTATLLLDGEVVKRLFGRIETESKVYCEKRRRAGQLNLVPSNISLFAQECYPGCVTRFIAKRPGNGQWNIELNQYAVERAELAEQQRQKDAAERQRQQEIAQAKIDAQSGDPLIGNWKSLNMTLRITKDGNLYLVHAYNSNGQAKGDFAGPYKDDQILIGGPFGNIAILQSKIQLVFAGETFAKAGQ